MTVNSPWPGLSSASVGAGASRLCSLFISDGGEVGEDRVGVGARAEVHMPPTMQGQSCFSGPDVRGHTLTICPGCTQPQ